MAQRRLFYALDGEGKRVLIDGLKERKGTYLCPHCKEPVIPKMGEEKVWHFAHVGEVCNALQKIDANTSDGSLLNFQTKESAKIEVGDSTTYLCPLCNTVGRKEYAVQLRPKTFVCKVCYTNAPSEKLQRFM